MPPLRVHSRTAAAERTFVSWLNIAVLVMFTSLSLMATNGPGFGGGRQNGIPQLPDAATTSGAAAAAAAVATGAPSLAPPGTNAAGLVIFDPCPPGSMCHSSQVGAWLAPLSICDNGMVGIAMAKHVLYSHALCICKRSIKQRYHALSSTPLRALVPYSIPK